MANQTLFRPGKPYVEFFNCPAIDISTTGRRFQAPHPSWPPLLVFGPRLNACAYPAPRFIRHVDGQEFLIFVAGACHNNGLPGASAGGAFIYRPATLPQDVGPLFDSSMYDQGACSFRLSNKGPNGAPGLQTSIRAELTAVIMAIRFRLWYGEACRHLVIATDSTLVDASADFLHGWARNDWKTALGRPIKNTDLWEELYEALAEKARKGMRVSFWRISRDLNAEARRLAERGAAMPEQEEYEQILGGFC